MKILYLSACSQLGGAERALLDLLASIRAENPETSLHVVTTEDGPLVSECQVLGVETAVLKLSRRVARLGDSARQQNPGSHLLSLFVAAPALINYLLRLRAIIGSIAPDLIHTNGFKMHVLGALAKPNRVPLIWHLHDYVSSRPFMARLLGHVSRFCSLAVANSEGVAADFRSAIGSRIEVKTIHNAIDLNCYSATGAALDLDELSGMRPSVPDTVKVGLIATFARWKGHEAFLRALSLLPRELPVRGYIIGDAIYQTNGSQYSLEELQSLAHQIGVSDRVGFTKFVNDSAAAMRALDIVVHASTEREPFGLVIAEAAACGKAIIASEPAGATELMKDGTDFLKHHAGDPVSLAAQLLGLSLISQVRRKLGAAAQRTAESAFDRKRLGGEVLPLYRSMMSASDVGDATPELRELCSLTSDI